MLQCVTLAPCRCSVSVRRQALCAGRLQQVDLRDLLRRARKNGYAVGARQLNKVEGC